MACLAFATAMSLFVSADVEEMALKKDKSMVSQETLSLPILFFIRLICVAAQVNSFLCFCP